MKTETFEKFVPVADWHELWAGRSPDFRGVNELRTLKRRGIAANYKRLNGSLVLVTAEALTDDHVAYLEKRDFCVFATERQDSEHTNAMATLT